MEQESTLKSKVYDFSSKSEIEQTILLFLFAFLVPTFLGGLIKAIFGATSVITQNSQIIVGSIVNTLLIVSALNIKGFGKIAAVCTAPSISTVMSGYVFKSASVYMAWMIPAIWIGNFALIYAYKLVCLKNKKNYFLAAVLGIVVKVAVIFGCFCLLSNVFGVFPAKLVSNLTKAMGLTQVITATIGSIISFVIYSIENKKAKSNN